MKVHKFMHDGAFDRLEELRTFLVSEAARTYIPSKRNELIAEIDAMINRIEDEGFGGLRDDQHYRR